MTEDKKKKITIGCIIAGVVILIIVLTTLILKVKRAKVRNTDKSNPSEYSSSDITSKETERESVTDKETGKETTESQSESVKETTKEQNTEPVTEPVSVTVPQEQPAVPAGNDKVTHTVSYSVVLKKNNSWSDGTSKFFQYECIVTNNTEYDISSWKFEGNIGNISNIENSWNGNFTCKDGLLVITPVDWNGNVKAGQSVSTCGVIVKGSNLKEAVEYKGTVTITDNPAGNNSNNSNNNNNNNSNNGSNSNGGNNTPTSPETKYEPPKLESGTPLANHGKLSVNGVNLVDSKGQKFQLKGVSTHGLQWFPQYVNKDTFKDLRDNWGANVIRLAMYSAEGGYCNGNTAEFDKIIDRGVQACSELGMYVIIDWHILSDSNPNTNKEQAKQFFAKMSKRYADYGNVIYEICNEPNGGVSWSEIKKYADEVIPVIRQYSKDAIIICGTPTWSQDVDQVASNPLQNGHNVMYAVHFYAATHKDDLRNKVVNAIKAGTPVFVSEFSICDASGNGGVDYDSAGKWKELIKNYNLSFAGWSLCNKGETSALIKSGVSKLSGFTTSDLSETGIWLRNFIAGK